MENKEQRLIPQTGAAALWRVDFVPDTVGQEVLEQTCSVHVWTCIWCSMSPPICGSCRPVTPPCPASGRVHVCACRARLHTLDAA